MDISQFKNKFIDEATDLLNNLDNILLTLETIRDDKASINEAFRVMHTIKGAAGMYGMDDIVEITHELESLYDLVRDQRLVVSDNLIELTFISADHIRNLLAEDCLEEVETSKNHLILKENIEHLKTSAGILSVHDDPKEPKKDENTIPEIWEIVFFPDESLIKRGVNLSYTFDDLFALGEYNIKKFPETADEKLHWYITLVTEKSYAEIEEALLFILENCKIHKLENTTGNPGFQTEFINKEYAKQVFHSEVASFSGQSAETITDKNESELLDSFSKLKKNITRQIPKLVSDRINVDHTKLDTLMFLVSELVTTKSEIINALQRQDYLKAEEAAEKLEKLSKLFSDNALNIRLVTLHEMLTRFKKLIRDLAKDLGKKIEFIVSGEDTELDKKIIDIIGEPIMHLIRNCIDHGIEIPKKRLEKGKNETGIIKFEAHKSGNYIFLTISDDGNGIDTDYIYKKAVEKGFITANEKLSNDEILNLIFLPGFSTAKNLTEVSGRGVGMEIVLKKVQEVRGEITISTTKDKGTSFCIKLQQTISIINTLLFNAGNITYAIPIEDIEYCDLIAHEDIINRQSNLIVYSEELIPFLNLREKFSSQTNNPETEKIIIINRHNKRYALIVDKIIGEYQIVVKPLGKTFEDLKFISGASILGDGSIAILIDADKLRLEISAA